MAMPEAAEAVGQYSDMNACVEDVATAVGDAAGFCAALKDGAAGKTTDWFTIREDWPNGRIVETFISSEVVDKQGEKVPLAQLLPTIPYLLIKGYYEWMHDGIPIGQYLAFKFDKHPITNELTVKVRVGIHASTDPLTPPALGTLYDQCWEQMKSIGTAGESSIRGVWGGDMKCTGNQCYVEVKEMGLFAVGYVGRVPGGAQPNADVTFLSDAKAGPSVRIYLGDKPLGIDVSVTPHDAPPAETPPPPAPEPEKRKPEPDPITGMFGKQGELEDALDECYAEGYGDPPTEEGIAKLVDCISQRTNTPRDDVEAWFMAATMGGEPTLDQLDAPLGAKQEPHSIDDPMSQAYEDCYTHYPDIDALVQCMAERTGGSPDEIDYWLIQEWAPKDAPTLGAKYETGDLVTIVCEGCDLEGAQGRVIDVAAGGMGPSSIVYMVELEDGNLRFVYGDELASAGSAFEMATAIAVPAGAKITFAAGSQIEIVSGRHRVRAARAAGLKTITLKQTPGDEPILAAIDECLQTAPDDLELDALKNYVMDCAADRLGMEGGEVRDWATSAGELSALKADTAGRLESAMGTAYDECIADFENQELGVPEGDQLIACIADRLSIDASTQQIVDWLLDAGKSAKQDPAWIQECASYAGEALDFDPDIAQSVCEQLAAEGVDDYRDALQYTAESPSAGPGPMFGSAPMMEGKQFYNPSGDPVNIYREELERVQEECRGLTGDEFFDCIVDTLSGFRTSSEISHFLAWLETQEIELSTSTAQGKQVEEMMTDAYRECSRMVQEGQHTDIADCMTELVAQYGIPEDSVRNWLELNGGKADGALPEGMEDCIQAMVSMGHDEDTAERLCAEELHPGEMSAGKQVDPHWIAECMQVVQDAQIAASPEEAEDICTENYEQAGLDTMAMAFAHDGKQEALPEPTTDDMTECADQIAFRYEVSQERAEVFCDEQLRLGYTVEEVIDRGFQASLHGGLVDAAGGEKQGSPERMCEQIWDDRFSVHFGDDAKDRFMEDCQDVGWRMAALSMQRELSAKQHINPQLWDDCAEQLGLDPDTTDHDERVAISECHDDTGADLMATRGEDANTFGSAKREGEHGHTSSCFDQVEARCEEDPSQYDWAESCAAAAHQICYAEGKEILELLLGKEPSVDELLLLTEPKMAYEECSEIWNTQYAGRFEGDELTAERWIEECAANGPAAADEMLVFADAAALISKQAEGMVRYWITYDGGSTQEREIAQLAERSGGRQVATTGDTVVVDLPAEPVEGLGDFEEALGEAGYEISESSTGEQLAGHVGSAKQDGINEETCERYWDDLGLEEEQMEGWLLDCVQLGPTVASQRLADRASYDAFAEMTPMPVTTFGASASLAHKQDSPSDEALRACVEDQKNIEGGWPPANNPDETEEDLASLCLDMWRDEHDEFVAAYGKAAKIDFDDAYDDCSREGSYSPDLADTEDTTLINCIAERTGQDAAAVTEWLAAEIHFLYGPLLRGKPFADYADFDDCVAKNADKDDPAAYCASIQRNVEGKYGPGCDAEWDSLLECLGRPGATPEEIERLLAAVSVLAGAKQYDSVADAIIECNARFEEDYGSVGYKPQYAWLEHCVEEAVAGQFDEEEIRRALLNFGMPSTTFAAAPRHAKSDIIDDAYECINVGQGDTEEGVRECLVQRGWSPIEISTFLNIESVASIPGEWPWIHDEAAKADLQDVLDCGSLWEVKHSGRDWPETAISYWFSACEEYGLEAAEAILAGYEDVDFPLAA